MVIIININNMMEELGKIISEKLSLEETEIEPDTDLFSLEEFDSLFIVELIIYLESELGLTIPEEYYALENYKTLRKINDTINTIMNGSSEADQNYNNETYIAASKEE